MVTLGRRPKPRLKPTNRIGVSRRTASSATRRGGSLRAPRGLLVRRCRDVRQGEGSAADIAANTADDPMHDKRLMIRRRTSPRADTASEVEHGARSVRTSYTG